MSTSVPICNPGSDTISDHVSDPISDSVLPKPIDRNLIKALCLDIMRVTNSKRPTAKNLDIRGLASRFEEACERYVSTQHIVDEN